ncbi:MAG: acyl-CoA dehydrogenase, partial [Arenicella sp.]|nr:acyl-CoA dehydrogenase [Arenicella sp.]
GDIFLVFAQSDGNISAFLVERDMPGVSTTAMTNVMAGRASHLAKIKLDQVKVPKENLVGRLGMGFSFVANTALFYGRYSIAWAGCALAQAALEEMVSYARSREQFSVKIAQHQLVQGIIANAVTQLHVGRNTCEKIAQMRIDNDEDAVTETNIAKLFTSRMAMQVATQAVQILGANGFSEDYPVERLFREAKVLEVIEGSSQIQQQMIAQYGLTKYFRKTLKEGSERCV